MKVDLLRHNEEVKIVWDAFYAGKPVRVPMIIGCNIRMILLDPKLNMKKITFKEYSEDPDIMLKEQMGFRKWYSLNVPQDARMGVPEEGYNIVVDLQNYSEAAWFGCGVHYREGQVPDTEPILNGDKKNILFDKGIPGPFGGLMAKNIKYYEYFKQKQKENYRFEGIPVSAVELSGMGTDGVMTTALNLRGVELLTDFYEDPEYVKKLFAYITEATIKRIKAFREYLNIPEKSKGIWFADDSIANISADMYKEFVMPYHKKLIAELSEGGPSTIHLCGDATRHFKTIRDELNVNQFDTGFPVDFGRLRKELGRDVVIYGGPNINLLLRADIPAIVTETKRILQSGITEGGKFVIREGNNLAPCTPM
ncbi:MAG: uroporphyrinogen decarboxylase family protein, partial [Candidatus Firestonebacteria bacterium]